MKVGMHRKCSKYLDKNDPIDRAILELVKENTLNVGFINLNNDNSKNISGYSKKIFPTKTKHTS